MTDEMAVAMKVLRAKRMVRNYREAAKAGLAELRVLGRRKG